MSTEITRVIIDGQELPIVIDLAAGRVELDVAGHLASIAFRVQGTQLAAVHTEVPEALRGKGVGNLLARALLDYLRREGMTIQPVCPFVAAFIARHGEYSDLIDPAF